MFENMALTPFAHPQDTTTGSSNSTPELQMGEVFSPPLEGIGEGFSSPKARTPLRATPHLLLETPYISNLRILLAEALNRPVTVFNRQRHTIFAVAMEGLALPLAVALALVINGLRLYHGGWGGDWGEGLLVGAVGVALPLVPLTLPPAWLALNWLGTARILALYHQAGHMESEPLDDPFEEADLEILRPGHVNVSGGELRTHVFATMCGTQPGPTRTANILHALASVTNLCCVDKKGVLSWPNPTAEKVFFLKNRGHNNINNSAPSLYGDDGMFEDEGHLQRSLPNNATKESESVLMSLTHDHQTAFGLQFDDPMWRRYLLSLKPLGLNILLNTCNPATQEHYTQFCAHITCEAMYNEDLVPVSQRSGGGEGWEGSATTPHHTPPTDIPVTSRGCLCELAKQIGFSQQAQQPFVLEHQLSTFRHVPPDMACKDRLAKSLMITKLKFPFPHMVSVLVRDRASRKLELMSQGTADIILDSCTDYWDGHDVCPLTEKDRKKILDFYHRTSLSAYCTAFSYRPTSCVVGHDLSALYMELPLDPSHLYSAARTPTPHISTEALFGDHHHTEYEEVEDIDDAFRMQCKQIFIGMVTMQYQAKTDMVQMIEQLDASCIRFVHFSKENELRSRVFSEKMGLESGWNCHISLLSDRTSAPFKVFRRSKSLRRKGLMRRSSLEVSKGLSHSAPSAINLEVAQVKFEDEVSVCSELSHSSCCRVEARRVEGTEMEMEREEEEEEDMDSEETRLGNFGYHCDGGTSEECIMLGGEEDEEEEKKRREEEDDDGGSSRSRSPSRVTESTERSPIIDLTNRARLPKGMENIRPHLKNVDNVPLLVSLFTDCTPPTTRAMLVLMQEYTEVTVVMGSSANADNMPLFMQADASLSVDPLYPQVCMREAVSARPPTSHGPPPEEVARALNVLPCSLSLTPHSRVSLVSLIMEARHYMQQVMSCLQFWACCCLSLTFLQLLAATAALPPLLSSGDVLWLVVVVVPWLSLSLVAAPTNPAVMNQATGKNTVLFNKQIFHFILRFYVCKFVPSILVAVMCGGATFASFCYQLAEGADRRGVSEGEDDDGFYNASSPYSSASSASSLSSVTDVSTASNSSSSSSFSYSHITCTYVYPEEEVVNAGSGGGVPGEGGAFWWGGWGDQYPDSLNLVQCCVAFLLVYYFCIISVSFVHRMYTVWRRNPMKNRWWAATVFALLVLQVVYSCVSLSGGRNGEIGGGGREGPGFSSLPPAIWLPSLLWPLLALPLNEFIKHREIRINVRYQKHARLEFGTKLGMNSPF
ncbi:transmembrane protein 94-like isoform X3 [Eriocheir sinensis]|uniref:transmembrane protein 94-like isoform X3 n=1 Tax=Eriocheir sinensis TaxID=95602 RepID=UPI0021C9BB3B|nr:transmembrane protein 94-like isoform X3 [Eriocheir sinensis]